MRQYHPFYYLNLLVVFLLCNTACTKKQSSPILTHAVAADFEEAKQVSPQLATGFEMDLWAPGPLLSNAVAVSFDNNGVAYVAETARRKSSDLDIRQHRDWMIEDLALQSIAETKAFHLKKLDPALSEANTWQEDFNEDGLHDYRDLEVQTEFIRRIWDSDQDGRADVSHLYAADFNKMLTGVAAGILSYGENIYLTAAPDLYRLQDKDKDGVADEKEVLSSGYGLHIGYAGHDMSGLTMGMDGKVYWSIGDLGVNATGPDGKNWAYPNQGAVMRCNPDGSEFEVFAHGVRNPQELAFDSYGNLLSVDNDGDHRGEKERYLHLVEGSDTGWRINWQYGKYNQPNEAYKIWMDEKLYLPHFEGQAAYLLPPIALAYDGPAGLAYNPGSALGKEWNDYFFASYFTGSSARSKIQAFKIKPKGASFEIDTIQDIVGGIVPTGITFGPDGALYVNDWKDSYSKKPTGRIWKLDVEKDLKNKNRTATQQLLQKGFKNTSLADLGNLIAHEDQRIRMGAQFELVNRAALEELVELAKNAPNLFGKLHAIWGIGQLARKDKDKAAFLLPFLTNETAEIIAQTAKVIGDAHYAAAYEPLLNLLAHKNARIQFYAAEALGKIGNPNAFHPLVKLLEKIEESDPHLRHAIIFALSRLQQPDQLADLAQHPSKYVRIGAVVALRHLKSPKVTAFLNDSSDWVLAETARAINDDFSIPDALPALAATLITTSSTNEAFLRRAINANLRLGDKASAQRLSQYAQQSNAPEAMRYDALWALGYWSKPPVLDRVDSRYRPLKGHQLAAAQQAFQSIFANLSSKVNTFPNSIKEGIITAAGRLDYQAAIPFLFDLFKTKTQPLAIRKASIQALAALKSKNLPTAITLALEDKNLAIRVDAQNLLAKVDLPKADLINMYEKILTHNSIPEKQKAFASIASIKAPETETLLKKWLDKFIAKQIDPALQLDLINAIENSDFPLLKEQLNQFKSAIDSNDVLAQYQATLYGGDIKKGKNIFSKNNTAQCLRCHIIQGNGGEVGPPLDGIAQKLDRESLLMSLVAPNARLAPGYGTLILKLKDGQEVAGILLKENEQQIHLKIGNDPEKIIAKTDIVEREALPSGMFNMGEVLSKGQIRDLVAFLVTLE
jgi:putative membrane-bound dehydrogenase-like protein